MIQAEGAEPKYPNLANFSRAERDQLIINSLEAVANELNRLSKSMSEVLKKL